MAPKRSKQRDVSAFQPSAQTLSGWQMPPERSLGESSLGDSGPRPDQIDATYSAECRALGAEPPPPPPAGRKSERPSGGRFWENFAKAASKAVGRKKQGWAPAKPPPPPRPRGRTAPPAMLEPSLSDVGKQLFDDATRRSSEGGALAYPQHPQRAATEPARPSMGGRDSSFGSQISFLEASGSGGGGARHSMNRVPLPQDGSGRSMQSAESRNWATYARRSSSGSDPLALPPDFRWDSNLGIGSGSFASDDGMDISRP
mmetsp:Transcript_17269/g.53098  ORF Transcript_17269/g.53098 Transcript_17269/m.53098 type:complete len:258 (+) Transcript_17269:467-1240(+)